MPAPDWLNYEPTESDHRQHAEMVLWLMEDHQQTFLFATRELSELYRRLCDRRAQITETDAETRAMIEDHENGIIDRVVGACLVVLQGEVARLTDLKRSADGETRKNLSDQQVRRDCCPIVKTYSTVESVFQLANLFKHDAELAAAAANDELKPHQTRTTKVAAECGDPKLPLIYNPGELERAVRSAFACSPELGLEPMSAQVESWRAGLIEQIRAKWVDGRP